MSRLPPLARPALTSAQDKLSHEIAFGDRLGGNLMDAHGRLRGPFNAMLHSPVIGDALQNLGSRIRFHGSLSDRVRESCCILVAAGRACQFELTTHVAIGLSVGVSDAEIQELRRLQIPATFAPTEAASVRVILAALDHTELTDAEYADIENTIGPEAFVELVILGGYYSLLADLMSIFGTVK